MSNTSFTVSVTPMQKHIQVKENWGGEYSNADAALAEFVSLCDQFNIPTSSQLSTQESFFHEAGGIGYDYRVTMEKNPDPKKLLTTNAIMFSSDGETWYAAGKPDATFAEILQDWKNTGGNPIVTTEYPGLQFGIITATVQDYHDCLTTGLKAFFKPAVEMH